MTKEEFIKSYCDKSDMTKEELLESQVVLPCKCDYEGCNGWAVVSNSELSIKAHLELYQ